MELTFSFEEIKYLFWQILSVVSNQVIELANHGVVVLRRFYEGE